MSRATPDDQLKFLLNCVKHSNNGKIDFVEVAAECGIVSKGAAAKRYERLMKANGIHPNGGPSDTPVRPAAPATGKASSKAAIAKAAAAKRRKIEGDGTGLLSGSGPAQRMKMDDGEDEEGMGMETRVKMELGRGSGSDVGLHMKAEPSEKMGVSMPGTASYALSSNPTAAGFGVAAVSEAQAQTQHPPHAAPSGSPSIFDEFCVPEMFSQHSFEEVKQEEHVPRYMPPPLPPPPVVVVDRLKQELGVDGRESDRGSGKAPSECILIAD